jgi:hypothetical protein
MKTEGDFLRREAIENEAGERAAAIMADPDKLLAAVVGEIDFTEDMDLMHALSCCYRGIHARPSQVIPIQLDAWSALTKCMESVFGAVMELQIETIEREQRDVKAEDCADRAALRDLERGDAL